MIYVAYGAKARAEAAASIASLRSAGHGWPVLVVGDAAIAGAPHRRFEERGAPGRWAKVNLDRLAPWEHVLFLDADTRVHGDLSAGFRLLKVGYDLVMVASGPQHNEAMRHLAPDERAATLRELALEPLQLNSGVMWFARERVRELFAAWREEWMRWRDKDQGALLRALYRHPVALALLGHPYNSGKGEVVEHRFGACGG